MKTTFASVKKLGFYFFCVTLFLFQKTWCLPYYAEHECMKMSMLLRCDISENASDADKIYAIKSDFESAIKKRIPGHYTYREDLVAKHIKDIPTLLTLRGQLSKIWNNRSEYGNFCSGSFHIAHANFPRIYIYYDDGVSDFSAHACEKALNELAPCLYETERIDAAETILGSWKHNAAAYIIPGGKASYYSQKLNGAGNEQIRSYVEVGGTYIGFCADAYYGAHYSEFHKGDRRGYEILVTRELSFFPGAAIGPVLAAYDYQSISGSRIAKIKRKNANVSTTIYNVFFNGGCYFKDVDQCPNTQVIACYADAGFEERAAIIECKIAKGNVILSGVHPEYNIADLYASLTSEEDRNHFKRHILPGLSDLSHKSLFNAIINRIR